MAKRIPLTKGVYATVDDDLFPALTMLGGWYLTNGYAARVGYVNGKPKHVFMHTFIGSLMGLSSKLEVDHKDCNKLNNRRENLRESTRSQQQFNKTSNIGTSKYKGVHWAKDRQRWTASIRVDGKKKTIGHYLSERDAAIAYDEMARKHHGEFARTNF